MRWKSLLTTITLSSVILSACGTNDDTAMNNAARNNQDNANLRTVSHNQGNGNNNGRLNNRIVDNRDLGNWGTRNDLNTNDNSNRNNHTGNRWINNPTSNQQHQNHFDDSNRRITDTNRNNQNRDITARNIADNTADNDHDNNRNQDLMKVADRAAEKITEMREVEGANVIVTNHNAYVAAKLADHADKDLTANVERKISDLVKSTNREIDNVYVSVNPDFYKRTTSYAEDIRNGQPIEGLFDEFGELIRRVFPTNR